MMLIDPKEITITTQRGTEKTFVLSKLPATVGREVVAKYPVSNMPKVGDYQVSEEIMLKLMSYVAVQTGGAEPIRLTTRALVDNHCEDWETLAKLEWSQLEYNVSFFAKGQNSAFYDDLMRRGAAWITKMLTTLSEQSSAAAKPPSTN